MDERTQLEQHDRARQLLLEGERSPGLEEHVAACAVCGPLALRLAKMDSLLRDAPEPPQELLDRILRPRRSAGPAEPTGRIEMLWPTDSGGGSPARAETLLPLVLSVEADRYYSHATEPSRTERFIIVGRHPITIGRGPDLDVPMWDKSVSRRHAQIDWRGSGWVIRDLESTNGTRVNGVRVGSDITHLSTGDRIKIGEYARITVRDLLPALDPLGVVREIHRLLAWASRPGEAQGRGERTNDQLRERLVGLREETVQLRDRLSQIKKQGGEAEAIPEVVERLTNLLALIEGGQG